MTDPRDQRPDEAQNDQQDSEQPVEAGDERQDDAARQAEEEQSGRRSVMDRADTKG